MQLLSGQNLAPLGKKCTTFSVQISLCGIPEDCSEILKAETVDSFWPQWPENQHTLKHRILMPELVRNNCVALILL